jgi:hypothetical protein
MQKKMQKDTHERLKSQMQKDTHEIFFFCRSKRAYLI